MHLANQLQDGVHWIVGGVIGVAIRSWSLRCDSRTGPRVVGHLDRARRGRIHREQPRQRSDGHGNRDLAAPQCSRSRHDNPDGFRRGARRRHSRWHHRRLARRSPRLGVSTARPLRRRSLRFGPVPELPILTEQVLSVIGRHSWGILSTGSKQSPRIITAECRSLRFAPARPGLCSENLKLSA